MGKKIKNKRIIICGPTASGKSYLRKKLEKRGFKCDISYTTRKPRENEINGKHYHFLEKNQFEILIASNFFYEWVQYNDEYYGTGLKEWNELPLFIMETDGISKISVEDRKTCFIIYLNPPLYERFERMRKERNWDDRTIEKRLVTDNKKFNNFEDYDMIIQDSYIPF